MTPRLAALLAVAALAAGACLPEPTPPVERPDDLAPIQIEPQAEPDVRSARTAEAVPVVGPVVLGVLARSARALVDLPLGHDASAVDAERRPLGVLAVTANMRGELNLCDCKDRPRGGLARRASALGALRQLATDPGEQPIVVDVGDALSPTLANPAPDDSALAERADVILAALGAMQLDAMLVNTRDLRVGVEALVRLGREHAVPLVSSNLVHAETREPVFETGRLVERGELRLGFVGLTPTHRTNARFLRQLGLVQLDAEDAVAQASGALREDGADAVVLLSGLGLRETEALLEGWRDPATRPDLALVSGTARLTGEPSWADGVALLEAGDRARQLLVVRLYPDEQGELVLTREPGTAFDRQELLDALELIGSLGRNIESRSGRLARAAPLNRQHLDGMREALVELGTVIDVLQRPPEPATAPALEVEVVELPYTLVPDGAIQAIVDRVEVERSLENGSGPAPTPPQRPQRKQTPP